MNFYKKENKELFKKSSYTKTRIFRMLEKLKYISSDEELTNCTVTLLHVLFKVQNICVAHQKRKDTYH